MKNKGILFIVGVIAAAAVWMWSSYNAMVGKEEKVMVAWSQVENQYQRRADLIPNLVNTVKGYAAHEEDIFNNIAAARSKAMQTQVNIENLSPEVIAQFSAAQGEISASLSRLMAVAESYPDLKASENFVVLQTQLEGTENRIAVERGRFNEAVNSYNAYIRRIPAKFFADSFGFERKGYFEAEKGSDKAPTVNF